MHMERDLHSGRGCNRLCKYAEGRQRAFLYVSRYIIVMKEIVFSLKTIFVII